MNKPLRSLIFITAVGSVAIANATEYQLTITNVETGVTLGGQPLSPLFFATSNSSFNEFSVGQTASAGIKNISEFGDATDELAIGAAAKSSGSVADYGLIGGTPEVAGVTRSTLIWTDSTHTILNFAAMLGKTSDGFIGDSVSSGDIDLSSPTYANGFTLNIWGSQAWDAGTALNTQNAIDLAFLGGNPNNNPNVGGVVGLNPGVTPGVGDSWQLIPSWQQGSLLATVKLTATPSPAAALPFIVGIVARRRRRIR